MGDVRSKVRGARKQGLTISKSNAAASPTCAENFSREARGRWRGEKSVQHSSQSNQYWTLRVRIVKRH